MERLYALAVFGVLTVCWEFSARRAAEQRSPLLDTVFRDGPIALVTMVGSAVVVYLASWTGWIAGDNGWSRQWAVLKPATGLLGSVMPDWARSLWHYHWEMWHFHSGLTTSHDYASDAWGWLLLTRPVSFDYTGLERGQQGCEVDKCSQAVLALGTPLLWWGACLALAVCGWMWLARRDWRAGAILAGFLATWAPWFLFPAEPCSRSTPPPSRHSWYSPSLTSSGSFSARRTPVRSADDRGGIRRRLRPRGARRRGVVLPDPRGRDDPVRRLAAADVAARSGHLEWI